MKQKSRTKTVAYSRDTKRKTSSTESRPTTQNDRSRLQKRENFSSHVGSPSRVSGLCFLILVSPSFFVSDKRGKRGEENQKKFFIFQKD